MSIFTISQRKMALSMLRPCLYLHVISIVVANVILYLLSMSDELTGIQAISIKSLFLPPYLDVLQ